MSRPSARILVVDDEPDMARNAARVLRDAGHEAIIETNSEKVMELVERERPDLIVTDLRMPKVDGLALLDKVKAAHLELPVLVITGYASVDSAVDAMRKGATDYLAKPFQPEELVVRVERAIAWTRLADENRLLRERGGTGHEYGDIIGESEPVVEMMRLVDKLAPTDTRVLIVGESGTGKELIARTLHKRSARQANPFFAVNCGAMTESLLESELFGHDRGAFTGAVAAKKGIFEIARGGTLLLDEISETSIAFQTKLLRVVQYGEFLRLGGSRPLNADVRILASTHRDLRKAIAAGRFREDLFYRLSVVQIRVPALRERIDDIPLLVQHFVAACSAQIKKHVRGVHAEAMEALTRYRWPGNVRELENVIERAVIMVEDGGEIVPEHLPGDLLEENGAAPPTGELKAAERELIVRTLKECNFNRSLTAKKLGIGRRTLYEKLSRYGVSLHPSL